MLFILRFIAIFFLVIFLLSLVSRLVIRYFFKRMGSQFESNNGQTQQRPEGEVYVKKTPKKDKIVDKNVGDYVDYEEVD
jgi:uncharacterized protein YpmB